MGGLDWTPQTPLSLASFRLCKLPNLPNLASLGDLHGDGTVELHVVATIAPLLFKKKIPSFFFLFSSLSSSFCCCCHHITMTMMMKTTWRKVLHPSFFQVEIIIMSLTTMMSKGWKVSWMPMLWSSFI